MSRPARPWFRFYTEAFKDFKILRLDPAERWVWVAILGAARESCEPGKLLIAPGEPMSGDELARYADVPHDQVWTALKKMERYGMVSFDEDGLIVVQNWDSRQYESDTSASRTAKYRTKDCDAETPSQPPSQHRHSDAGSDDIVTDQIQRQITETEHTSPHDKRADAYSSDFDAWYSDYPRRIGRAKAFAAYKARRREGITPDQLTQARDHYAKAVAGSEFIKYPASFLAKDGPWSEWEHGPPEGFVASFSAVPAMQREYVPSAMGSTREVNGVTQRFYPGTGWI